MAYGRTEGPHGEELNVERHFDEWFRAASVLPSNPHLYLSFSSFWQDFRALRSSIIRQANPQTECCVQIR